MDTRLRGYDEFTGLAKVLIKKSKPPIAGLTGALRSTVGHRRRTLAPWFCGSTPRRSGGLTVSSRRSTTRAIRRMLRTLAVDDPAIDLRWPTRCPVKDLLRRVTELLFLTRPPPPLPAWPGRATCSWTS